MSGALNEPTKIAFFFIILGVNLRFFFSWVKIFLQEFTADLYTKFTDQFEMIFGRCMLERRIFHYRKNPLLPAQKDQGVPELKRMEYLQAILLGKNPNLSTEITDREYRQGFGDKGTMLYSILAEKAEKGRSNFQNFDEISVGDCEDSSY